MKGDKEIALDILSMSGYSVSKKEKSAIKILENAKKLIHDDKEIKGSYESTIDSIQDAINDSFKALVKAGGVDPNDTEENQDVNLKKAHKIAVEAVALTIVAAGVASAATLAGTAVVAGTASGILPATAILAYSGDKAYKYANKKDKHGKTKLENLITSTEEIFENACNFTIAGSEFIGKTLDGFTGYSIDKMQEPFTLSALILKNTSDLFIESIKNESGRKEQNQELDDDYDWSKALGQDLHDIYKHKAKELCESIGVNPEDKGLINKSQIICAKSLAASTTIALGVAISPVAILEDTRKEFKSQKKKKTASQKLGKLFQEKEKEDKKSGLAKGIKNKFKSKDKAITTASNSNYKKSKLKSLKSKVGLTKKEKTSKKKTPKNK